MEEHEIDDENFVEPEVKESSTTAKIVAVILQVCGLITGIYFFSDPPPVETAYLYYLVFPALTIASYRYFKGELVWMSSKTDKRYGLFLAIIFPQLFIAGAIGGQHSMLATWSLLVWSVIFAVPVVYAIAYRNEEFDYKTTWGKTSIAGIVVLAVALSYGFASLYNFSGQSNEPVKCRAAIAGKYLGIKNGKRRTYYHYHFLLKQWQFSNEGYDVESKKSTYDALGKGDSLPITVYHGKLNASWYEIPFIPSPELIKLMKAQ